MQTGHPAVSRFVCLRSGRPVSRLLCARRSERDDHLSGGRITPTVVRHTRRFLRDGPPQCACFALLPVRFAWPRHRWPRRWSLTPPFHPRRPERRQYASLWHSAVGLPRLAVSQHRCPVEGGLSSARLRLPRSPGQPERAGIIPQRGAPAARARGVKPARLPAQRSPALPPDTSASENGTCHHSRNSSTGCKVRRFRQSTAW